MKTLRFFTLPTLLGWIAAFLTCALIHLASSIFQFGVPTRSVNLLVKDYALMFVVGGALIVAPTFCLITFPLSIADFRRGSISIWLYASSLLLGGVVATALFAERRMIDIGWADAEFAQLLFFYTPFVPYALVVALAAKRFLPDERRA